MKKFSASVLFMLILSSAATASEGDGFINSLDGKLSSCKDKAENTLAIIDCYNVSLKKWDNELNNQYKLLKVDKSEDFKLSLKESQEQWIKYRDSYIKAMQSFYRQEEGTIWGIIMSEGKLRVTRDKAIELYKLRTSTDLS